MELESNKQFGAAPGRALHPAFQPAGEELEGATAQQPQPTENKILRKPLSGFFPRKNAAGHYGAAIYVPRVSIFSL